MVELGFEAEQRVERSAGQSGNLAAVSSMTLMRSPSITATLTDFPGVLRAAVFDHQETRRDHFQHEAVGRQLAGAPQTQQFALPGGGCRGDSGTQRRPANAGRATAGAKKGVRARGRSLIGRGEGQRNSRRSSLLRAEAGPECSVDDGLDGFDGRRGGGVTREMRVDRDGRGSRRRIQGFGSRCSASMSLFSLRSSGRRTGAESRINSPDPGSGRGGRWAGRTAPSAPIGEAPSRGSSLSRLVRA